MLNEFGTTTIHGGYFVQNRTHNTVFNFKHNIDNNTKGRDCTTEQIHFALNGTANAKRTNL